MGNNLHGRLGLGDESLGNTSIPCLVEALTHENLVAVACGATHTIAVAATGQAYSWGLGKFGALGVGSEATVYAPARIDFFAQREIKIAAVFCGHKHSFFVTSTSSLTI